MRIRKHAQISPLVYADSKPSGATYVCKLNQSPWDTINFPSSDFPPDPTASPQPPPPPPLLYPQVDGEDCSIPNGSFSDCGGAENSELSSLKFELDEGKEKGEEVQVDKNGNLEIEGINGEKNQMLGSSKSHGRKKFVKERLSNYPTAHRSSSTSHLKRHNKLTKRSVSRRIRPKKPASNSNPYEFYYYSGFGPRWGRRRGPTTATTKKKVERESYSSDSLNIDPTATAVKVEAEGESSYSSRESLKNNNVAEVDKQATSDPEQMESWPSRICIDGFDYIEDEDDDDEEEEDSEEFVRKKRARKPVKARSLKSLM